MVLNPNTVITSYFRTFSNDFTPTRAELENHDARLRQRYVPILGSFMRHYGLDPTDPDQVNEVIRLAEVVADPTPQARLDRACHFFAALRAPAPLTVPGASAAPAAVAAPAPAPQLPKARKPKKKRPR